MTSHVCKTPIVIWHLPEGARFDCDCGFQWALSGRLWVRLERRAADAACGRCRGAGELYSAHGWYRCTACRGSGVAA